MESGHNPSVGADSLYASGASLSVPSLLSSVPPVAPLAFDQRAESGSGLGVLSSSSLYGYGTLPVCNCGIVVTATIITMFFFPYSCPTQHWCYLYTSSLYSCYSSLSFDTHLRFNKQLIYFLRIPSSDLNSSCILISGMPVISCFKFMFYHLFLFFPWNNIFSSL